MSSMGKKR
jgi:hypothetical protein